MHECPEIEREFCTFFGMYACPWIFLYGKRRFWKNIYAIEKIFHYICGIIKRKKKTRFTNSHITWKQTKGEGTEIPSHKSSALTFAKEKLKEMSGFSAIWCTKKNCVLQFHNPQKHLIAKIFIAKQSFRRKVFAVRKYFYIFACRIYNNTESKAKIKHRKPSDTPYPSAIKKDTV